MLRVGIDITATIYQRGVSRYTANLVRALLQSDKVRLSLYGSTLRQRQQLIDIAEQLKKETGAKAETVIQAYPPSLFNFLWNTVGFPKVSSMLPKIEIFHSWDWLQPPDTNLPLVSTIHDLTLLKYPETAHPKILKMHQQSWEILKKRKAHIIAVSEATKKDIVQLLEIPASRVHVIHEALPIEFVTISDNLSQKKIETISKKLQLSKPFIFFVGVREPRKNLDTLIKAWKPLKDTVQLIIAGQTGWDETTGKEFQNIPELRFLGKVTDEELVTLYTQAEAFAYPSLYEGFGLPILEAFYHGTPVITSNVSSMPEVAGNAAELVDPQSVSSIQNGIETVLNESEAAQRKRLQRMVIRQQLFNWDQVAKQTIEVYQAAVDSQK